MDSRGLQMRVDTMHEHSIPWPGVLRRALACCAAVLLACCASWAQAPARPQTLVPTMRRPAFRAVSYDVTASLSPATQTLSARATVEFEASEPSRNLECELHPNLQFSDVLDANGMPVPFERDDIERLLVRVSLPDARWHGPANQAHLCLRRVHSPTKKAAPCPACAWHRSGTMAPTCFCPRAGFR